MKDMRIALLIDVDNVKITSETFDELYEKLYKLGDVVYCKFYGYNDRKHVYLQDTIFKYGYETAPFMRFKKRASQLDARILVDAVKLNYTKPEINAFCIIAGQGDLIPLLVELKSSGKTVIDINSEFQEDNFHMFDLHIDLNSLSVQNLESKKKKQMAKNLRSALATKQKTTKAATVAASSTRRVSAADIAAARPMARKPVVEEVEEEEFNDDDYYNEDFSAVLKDITDRYSALDFTTNSNINEKVELINDIEGLISEETKKGGGLNSKNADVRQIFIELQNIVDDMKNSL
ncbi:MAG: NYN domain-containing protein [Clostridia bacterium]|nr:NYN domain-containing protein [Clostridia bacterium]